MPVLHFMGFSLKKESLFSACCAWACKSADDPTPGVHYCRSLIARATADVLHLTPRADKIVGMSRKQGVVSVRKDVRTACGRKGQRWAACCRFPDVTEFRSGRGFMKLIPAVDARPPFISAANDLSS